MASRLTCGAVALSYIFCSAGKWLLFASFVHARVLVIPGPELSPPPGRHRYPPFHEEEPDVLWGKIEAGSYAFHEEFWSQVSDAAKDLIQNLLVVDPDNRYSASQALRHPWFFEDDKALSMNAFDTGNLRKFNAKRKLKGTVKMVILANRLAKSNQSQEPSPVQKDQ
jgi:serine/threonine protein kinase